MRAALAPFCLLLLVAALPASAEDSSSMAKRLVERSGLEAQLRVLPRQLDAELRDSSAGELPQATALAMREAAREAFRPERLQAEVVRVVARLLGARDMEKAMRWLETRAGRRITAAEERAAAQMDRGAMRRYAEREKMHPASAARVALLRELVDATQAAQSEATINEAMMLGVAMGMNSAEPPERRLELDELRSRVHAAVPPQALRRSIERTLPGLFAYIYRDLDDADLAAYRDFLRTPQGRRYNDAMTEGLSEALIRASVRLGKQVARAPARHQV